MNVKTISIVPIVLAVAFAMTLAVIAMTYYMPSVSAQGVVEVEDEEEDTDDDAERAPTEEDSSDEEEAVAEDDEQEVSDATYNYVAQPGDSYSEIARKAVQTYGLKNDVNLSQAQIIFAETNLTLEAQSPELTVGQEVVVSESAVETWVNQAEDLTDATEEAWKVYAAGVNFNTDNIGEVR